MNESGNEYREARIQKRDALTEMGVDPYAVRTPPRELSQRVRAEFEQAESAASGEDQFELADRALAGRVLANRKMGKAAFLDLYDGSGRMQIYLNKKIAGESAMAIYQQIDLGDFIWVKGSVQRTRTGEVTLFVHELQFLTKALAVPPLPRTYKDKDGTEHTTDALTDPELRHRKRYLDLMVHPEVRRRFEQRSTVIRTIRSYCESEGYSEVETPMMHSIPGGAAARPFVTHHNALGMELYMRVAPELHLKRLLVGGFERVYEINRCFRNEGIDHTHNPEFTTIELYEAYGDYHRMMEITEGMIVACARAIRGDDALKFPWCGVEIDLSPPFRRATYSDLVQEHAGIDIHDEGAVAAKARELELDESLDHYGRANGIFEAFVEDKLIQPTFVLDYPTAICPLTKAKTDDARLCERFELFIKGTEFANAFSELNNPVEQRKRFEEQVEAGLAAGDVEAPKEVDYDFVEALESGMPPAGGLGLGIDRLVMLLTDTDSIREVILFPQLRREQTSKG